MSRKFSSGDKNNYLVCIDPYVEERQGHWFGLWLCDCGTRKLIQNSKVMGNGRTTLSCGCRKSVANDDSRSRTYNSWRAMRARCTNISHPAFHNYGGRGISICEEWMTYVVFRRDMGDRPANKELDRIDVNGNYNKKNCRWVTKSENCKNRRKRG